MTDTKNKYIKNIIKKYNSEYPFIEKTVGFGVYCFSSEEDIIFNDSVEIPAENGVISFKIAEY